MTRWPEDDEDRAAIPRISAPEEAQLALRAPLVEEVRP
jgi:hypothetical protein